MPVNDMWMRFSTDGGDVSVNIDLVHRIRPNEVGSKTNLIYEDSTFTVNEPYEEVWSKILSYQEPVEITIESPQDITATT
jgi:hypothetical protein